MRGSPVLIGSPLPAPAYKHGAAAVASVDHSLSSAIVILTSAFWAGDADAMRERAGK